MNFLQEIITQKKHEVAELLINDSLSRFRDLELYHKRGKSFYSELLKSKFGVIAEIKKGSPSKGIFKDEFDHLELAQVYHQIGVNAISVITDEHFFYGNINNLSDTARITSIPLLRKDFIIDEIQIHQAKAFGASAILLIAEVLDKSKIKDLTNAAHSLELDVLLELHSSTQIEKIDFDLNKIIGINNRDLFSFKTDLSASQEIGKLLPTNVYKVAESGISNVDDIKFLKENRLNAALIGEHFICASNTNSEVSKFLKAANED